MPLLSVPTKATSVPKADTSANGGWWSFPHRNKDDVGQTTCSAFFHGIGIALHRTIGLKTGIIIRRRVHQEKRKSGEAWNVCGIDHDLGVARAMMMNHSRGLAVVCSGGEEFKGNIINN